MITEKISSPILEVKNVHKTFSNDILSPNKKVLQGLDFSIYPQSITAIFGHNGAGKTTCFRLILGMLKPDSGLILFKSRPLRQQDRRSFGYMPETKKMSQDLTPLEILRLQMSLNSLKPNKNTILETLEQVGLMTHRNVKIANLSKGMGRRLAWALATIHQPEILILDEPFSGLDPLAQQMMSEWIQDWTQKKAGTVLMSAHEVFLVKNLAHELVVFKEGKTTFSEKFDSFNEKNFLAFFQETES